MVEVLKMSRCELKRNLRREPRKDAKENAKKNSDDSHVLLSARISAGNSGFFQLWQMEEPSSPEKKRTSYVETQKGAIDISSLTFFIKSCH